MEGLNPGPPDYKTSALNHSATLPPSECHVIRHAKKEICNNSATENDFEFVFSEKDSPSHIVYDPKMSQF